ncbi:RNA-directed DNA polymerase, eukaryota [Tanacetum coccineum]
MNKIKEGIRVKVNGKYYDVLINEFAYWAPDFEFEDDCESNESSESDCSDGKKSDTSSGPTASEECYTEQPMHKSGQEQSDSDPFNLMGLIEKQGINLVKKDKESVINCDTDKETDQPITTEFNKDQGNECQDGSCNEQSIYNRKVRNENTHTNITEIKEAMANNTINDGMEETNSFWPLGYTEHVSNIRRNKKAQGGTKCNSTRGSMESTCSMRFKFSKVDFVRVSELGNIIGLEMPSSFNEVNRLLHQMSEINETFMKTDNLFSLRSIWGDSQFDYALVPSSGHSGGIVSIWNPYIFVKRKFISNPNVLIVQGRWLDVKFDIYMVNVYAPQDEEGKQNIWRFITEFMSTNPGHYIIFGDFNSVRNKSERFGSVFSNSNASYFNEFITNRNLVDIPIGGYKFTRVDKSCTKGSRLNRFLIADSTWNHLGPLTDVALDRTISDHHPILLRRCTADYGPIPFKIYHSWFQADGFDKVVTDFWSNGYYRKSSSALINFKNKLQGLKSTIKGWVNTRRSRIKVIDSLREELRSLDLHIDVRQGLHHRGEKRMKLVNDIHKLEHEQKEDLIQKSRIKWCVDGDENSNFFHGTINKKRKQLSVQGIKSNGQWVEEPIAVKQTFLNHFSKKNSKVTSIPYSARSNRFKMVSQHQLEILESEVSLEEIKEVVWDCGSDKSPAISEFFNNGDILIGCNASFITLIPKIESPLVILDGPMILNEVVHTLKRKKKKAMIFKVDIAKAYDTLTMEGFHIAMEDAIEAKKYIGINIGDVCLSHLIYADDVIVLGEWSQFNLVNILDIFNFFYLASGLQISVTKSKLYGIGATETELNHLDGLAGCKGEKLPFLYLGLPIGANMSRVSTWQPVIDKFSKRLSKWRANCLSIGGRSILMSAVLGSLPTYYLSLFRMPRTVCNKLEAMRSKFFWGAEDTNRKIHWVKWDLVLASKDRGGLGFGSLHSLNLALLYKWRWRFHNHHNALWAKIIKNLYHFSSEAQGWNGSSFAWNWRRPLRGGTEDDQYHRICDIIKQVTIVQTEDSWRWSWDKMDSFSVNGLRKHLDCLALPSHYLATRWNKIVPRKVNIHVWRLIKDRLPTRFNLWFRGIDNVSPICPMFNNGLESSYHTMSECIIAIKVWNSVVKWLNLNLPFQLPPNELLDFVNNKDNLHKAKDIIFTIIYTVWWELWRFRNDFIFKPGKKRDVDIVDSIIQFSYLWSRNRYKKQSMRWDDWLKNPLPCL